VEYKADSSPVTIADRESEQLLRRLLEERYPEHGILGEEFGLTRGEAPLRWYLDPIDGTQSFIRGVPLFGVMVGLVAAGATAEKQVPRPPASGERARDYRGGDGLDPLVGVVHLPALGETVVAWRGGGCWWSRGVGRVRAQVSTTARLEDALLLTTDSLELSRSEKRAAYERLRRRVKLERGWGDCYGHVLVATGRAEIMLDAALHEWDAAPLIPILEEAGGRFADWRGRRTISGGDGFASNGALFDAVLAELAGVARG
jgi:fructose-1,6-bisphosphatase/inositol monophosphatase family enzyme